MISIVIPIFNMGDYLRDAIDSILNQSWMTGDLEVIIVNDGSNDSSLKIANEYRANYLSKKNKGERSQIVDFKIIDQVNKGLASARNTGIMNAEGEWVFFLDADDMLLPDCLYRIWEITANFSSPDIIAPSFKCFGKGEETVILHPKITLDMFKQGQNFLPYFCAVRKSKLLEVGGYSPKMTWGWEDLHLWINLLSRGATVKTIPEVLVLYRTKEKSMWTESTKHSEELWAQIIKDFPALAQS